MLRGNSVVIRESVQVVHAHRLARVSLIIQLLVHLRSESLEGLGSFEVRVLGRTHQVCVLHAVGQICKHLLVSLTVGVEMLLGIGCV